jgi:hypothetical protein
MNFYSLSYTGFKTLLNALCFNRRSSAFIGGQFVFDGFLRA